MNDSLDFDAWLSRKRKRDEYADQQRREFRALCKGCFYAAVIMGCAIWLAWLVMGWMR